MARWNHVALPALMILMGVLLITGSLLGTFANVFFPLDQYLGTRGTIAGVVFGIGVAAAAVNPSAHVSWVRAAILYCAVDVVYEIFLAVWLGGAAFSLISLLVALIFGVLLVVLYPNRSALVPATPRSSFAARPAAGAVRP
jgi:hypothetical protein